ncbi:MAG: hypothetical protein J6I45_11350, partial [Clostridia bacterium]|nr:hypothetical protein [Clostridia bacterium]
EYWLELFVKSELIEPEMPMGCIICAGRIRSKSLLYQYTADFLVLRLEAPKNFTRIQNFCDRRRQKNLL